MKGWIARKSLVVVWLFVCLMTSGLSLVAQDERAADDFYLLTSVAAGSSCDNLLFGIYVNNARTGYFDMKLIYEGTVISDIFVNSVVGTLNAFSSSGYRDDRGLAPVNHWPLVPGKKIKAFVTLYDQNFEPYFESQAIMTSCDALTLKKTTHGRVHQLLQNSSFETPALDDAFLPVPDVAAFWNGKGTVNDARDCSPPSTYVGSCGFLFNADGVSKSKLSQTYAGTIGEAGDNIYLQGYAQRFAGYGGGGQFVAKLWFANGEVKKLKVDLPVGESLYNSPLGFPYYASTKMPAPLLSAKVQIKQGFSSAQIAVDAVTLSVMTNNDVIPRAVPPAPGTPMRDISAG